jgi:hypothetical protein
MTTQSADPVDLSSLRSASKGPALAAGEDGWDEARRAWNLTADLKPVAVAFADDADDVMAAVRFARERGLRVAAVSSGHGASALPDLDRTILLRTGRMKGVSVDPGARRARVEAGVLSLDLAAAAGEHGLATLGGSSPDVGVVGFALGGGIGWLSRKYGLTANTIKAADVVTADGELVRADPDVNADLFWALRGGGGDFGVVTALELELFELPKVYAGSLMWPMAHCGEILHAYLELVADAPVELSTGVRFLSLPPIPEVPEPLRGVPVIDVTGAFDGDPAEGSALLDPLRKLADPLIDGWAEMPAAGLSRIYGDPEQPTPGLTHHTVLGDLPPEAGDKLIELAGPDSGSPLLLAGTRHLGGALETAPPDSGALGCVNGEHVLMGVGLPMAPGSAPAIVAHLDKLIDEMQPWSTGVHYLNFADRPCDGSKGFSAESYSRLREVKGRVDPDGMFVAAHPVV